jgi:hypothetical protein
MAAVGALVLQVSEKKGLTVEDSVQFIKNMGANVLTKMPDDEAQKAFIFNIANKIIQEGSLRGVHEVDLFLCTFQACADLYQESDLTEKLSWIESLVKSNPEIMQQIELRLKPTPDMSADLRLLLSHLPTMCGFAQGMDTSTDP